MNPRVINGLFSRVLSWMLLIQVVNISIDPLDLPIVDSLGQFTAREDLSINDIESIYELVSEQYLGVDVPEQDEEDESGFVKVIDFYFSESFIIIKPNYSEATTAFTVFNDSTLSVSLENSSPPPRQA